MAAIESSLSWGLRKPTMNMQFCILTRMKEVGCKGKGVAVPETEEAKTPQICKV